MSPDHINAAYEFMGGVMLWQNVWTAYRDKAVQGVSIATTSFFASWGLWNLYYYPHLNQWWSLAGGICLSIPQCIWLCLLIRYRKREVWLVGACRSGKTA